jgi:NADPH:quinone reductase-like Zn-dependent oxidoreductase
LEGNDIRAIQLAKFNDLDSLARVDVADPKVGPNEILVRNHAVAVDPIDWKIATGFRGGNLPMILGSSLAGEVIAVGEGVTDFTVGDRVVANYRSGETYAELASVPVLLAAHIPDQVSFGEAVSIALGGQTGLQGITRGLDVRAGQKVVILGGSGSVGFIAMQTALNLGADVTVTASGWGKALIESRFPAVTVFDYKTEQLAGRVADVDGIFDTVGNVEAGNDALKTLKPDGSLVSVALRDANDRRVSHLVNRPEGRNIQFILDEMAAGHYHTVIDSEVPLTPENVKLDYERSAGGGLHGKLILTI